MKWFVSYLAASAACGAIIGYMVALASWPVSGLVTFNLADTNVTGRVALFTGYQGRELTVEATTTGFDISTRDRQYPPGDMSKWRWYTVNDDGIIRPIGP